MAFNWLKVIPMVVTAIDTVESIRKDRGKTKQDRAMDIVKVFVETAEGVAGKDLMDDPAVESATRATIDTIVQWQNVVNDAKARRGQ